MSLSFLFCSWNLQGEGHSSIENLIQQNHISKESKHYEGRWASENLVRIVLLIFGENIYKFQKWFTMKLVNFKESLYYWFPFTLRPSIIHLNMLGVCWRLCPTVFPSQLRFDGNFVLLSSRFYNNHYFKILHTAVVLSWHVQNLLWVAGQQLYHSNAKFLLNLNIKQKIISEMGPFYTMLFVPIFQQPGRTMN